LPSEEALAEGEDPQLEAALSYLNGQTASLTPSTLCKAPA
jgi:hypothetical protein